MATTLALHAELLEQPWLHNADSHTGTLETWLAARRSMNQPIRHSFGGDEHLFAEVSDSMSLDAFFKGMAVTRAVERLALDGVLDVCIANASFQIRFDPDRIAPHDLLEAVQGAEAGAVTERILQTRIIEIPVLYNDNGWSSARPRPAPSAGGIASWRTWAFGC